MFAFEIIPIKLRSNLSDTMPPLFFNREKKKKQKTKTTSMTFLFKKLVYIQKHLYERAQSYCLCSRIIRLIKYRLIIGTLKRGSCLSWVQVFENTCTNRNLANELRRWLDRNRMLLEMVFQAFLDASCHRKRTL